MTARRAAAEPGFIALEGGGARVEVVPALGGLVRSLSLGGREWLLRDAGGPSTGAEPPYGETGWQECAPAAADGTIPEWVKGVGGRSVPAGGEARTQRPEVDLRTGEDGHVLRCTWRGERLPWTLTRTLVVRPDGAVEARYDAAATGSDRLPFLWSACLLLPLTSTTRIRLPDAPRFRVQAAAGATVDALGGGQQWPRLMLDGRARDLSMPWRLPRASMVHGWLDLAASRTTLQVVQDEAMLTISTDGDGVPHCGLLIDRAGRRGGARRRAFSRGLAPALGLMPALGAPDRYAEALGDWQSVTWLTPGEPRHWRLTLRAERRA